MIGTPAFGKFDRRGSAEPQTDHHEQGEKGQRYAHDPPAIRMQLVGHALKFAPGVFGVLLFLAGGFRCRFAVKIHFEHFLTFLAPPLVELDVVVDKLAPGIAQLT